MWHLNRYDNADPTEGGEEFSKHTPFISTTGGNFERDEDRKENIPFPAHYIALKFATDVFQAGGFIFYGHVYTLGRRSVKLEDFSEEVRDLLVYTEFLPHHHEGEVVAKIHIPSIQLEKFEAWECDPAGRPNMVKVTSNPAYEAPERYANVRGVLG